MKGAAERRQTDHEMAIATGWWTNYLRSQKRIGPLGKYLKMIRGAKKMAAQRSAEIVSAFQSMQKRGLSVKVRRVPRGE
ncbi:MAG: hypothetical protein WA940_00435 [Sphingopyxis sp.]